MTVGILSTKRTVFRSDRQCGQSTIYDVEHVGAASRNVARQATHHSFVEIDVFPAAIVFPDLPRLPVHGFGKARFST